MLDALSRVLDALSQQSLIHPHIAHDKEEPWQQRSCDVWPGGIYPLPLNQAISSGASGKNKSRVELAGPPKIQKNMVARLVHHHINHKTNYKGN